MQLPSPLHNHHSQLCIAAKFGDGRTALYGSFNSNTSKNKYPGGLLKFSFTDDLDRRATPVLNHNEYYVYTLRFLPKYNEELALMHHGGLKRSQKAVTSASPPSPPPVSCQCAAARSFRRTQRRRAH